MNILSVDPLDTNTHLVNSLIVLFTLVSLVSCRSGLDAAGKLPPPNLPGIAKATGKNEAVFVDGDSVEVLVEEDSSFNGVFEVREGGYILIPKIGRLLVSGLTRNAVEHRVQEALQRTQIKTATVFVERRAGSRNLGLGSEFGSVPRVIIYVTGAVARPGQHAVPLLQGARAPGLFEVLLMAGGLARHGDESKIRILRLSAEGVRQSTIVDMRKIRDGLIADVPLGEGDIVQVPEKVFGF